MPYLINDKVSSINPATLYGRAGDEVEVLGGRGGLMLVGHAKTGTFFVKQDELTFTKPEKKPGPQADDQPASDTNSKVRPKQKKQKAAPINDNLNELF